MLKEFCSLVCKVSGWKIESSIPEELRSFIFLGAPHTSNLDFFPAMALAHHMNRHARFVIKSDWLKFPMNMILKPAGALGLDRKKLQGGQASNTDAMAQLFKEFPELVLMIAPEATRSPNENWKTGFYYIAQKAQVPIVLGYADFGRKVAGTGPIIYPENFEQDMRKIMEFYQKIQGRRPANFKLDSRFL